MNIMKNIISLFLFVSILAVSLQEMHGQITTNEQPFGLNNTSKKIFQTDYIDKDLLPNMVVIEAEDKVRDPDESIPLRFAYPVKVDYSIQKSGQWEELPNGDKLWTLDLVVPEALSTHVLYDKFWLPEGGKLFVYNRNTGQSIGAVTSEYLEGSAENPQSFATGLIYGENMTLEYYHPSSAQEMAIISISRIDYGYRFVDDPYKLEARASGFGTSGSCQVNINCSAGNNWQDQKHAVARLTVVRTDGSYWCSCALINNTRNNGIPYVLTANHCLGKEFDAITKPVANQWIFYWEYEHSGCSNSSSEPIHRTTIGATVVANENHNSSAFSDFALLRLLQHPQNLDGVIPYYLGWDRSTNPQGGGVCIQHPKGDVKKIATYDSSPIISLDNYWSVRWSSGVTEGGSSGSPLLTSNGNKILGQLWGSYDWGCADPTNDAPEYGKFTVSWTGNGATDPKRRLKDWLDPDGSDVNSLEGGYKFTGPEHFACSGIYSSALPGTWSVSNGFQIVSGQGTKSVKISSYPSEESTGTVNVNVVSPAGSPLTLTRNIKAGFPAVTSISGPTFLPAGGSGTYYAQPIVADSIADYEWVVNPSGTANIYPEGSKCNITFNNSYNLVEVGCRTVNYCREPGEFTTLVVSLSNYKYHISSDALLRQVTITPDSQIKNPSPSEPDKSLPYILYNQATGIKVANGKIPVHGGTLDFSNQNSGIYIFQLEVDDNRFETLRILFK